MELKSGDEQAKSFSNAELLKHIGDRVPLLIKKEIDLARAELKDDLVHEVIAAAGLLFGAMCGFLFFIMLLVAAVFGLAEVMPGWLAALAVGALLALIGSVVALIAWSKRIRKPFSRTRKSLSSDISSTAGAFDG